MRGAEKFGMFMICWAMVTAILLVGVIEIGGLILAISWIISHKEAIAPLYWSLWLISLFPAVLCWRWIMQDVDEEMRAREKEEL